MDDSATANKARGEERINNVAAKRGSRDCDCALERKEEPYCDRRCSVYTKYSYDKCSTEAKIIHIAKI